MSRRRLTIMSANRWAYNKAFIGKSKLVLLVYPKRCVSDENCGLREMLMQDKF